MREYSLGLLIVFLAACGSARSVTAEAAGGVAGSGGQGGAGGAGGSTAGGIANSSAGATDLGGGENACATGTVPADTVQVALNFPGLIGTYNDRRGPSTVDGYVLVERVERERLHLVDEAGQRLSLHAESPSVSFESISIGTQFWLSAFAAVTWPNPINSLRFQRFALRAEQNGPVLFGSLQGMKEGGEVLLGVPVSFKSLCSFSSPSEFGGTSPETGKACTRSTELFDATLETIPPVNLLPGTRVEVAINDKTYDLALRYASRYEYPGQGCRPADWLDSLALRLDVAARDWQELSADQPVVSAQLPACRLGVDARLLTFDLDRLNWQEITESTGEYAISGVSTVGDTLAFSLSSYGELRVTGLSPEGRAVLERGRWFSRSSGKYVIRESEGGPPLAVQLRGTAAEVAEFVLRADVLGVSVAVEPRCAWMSDACRDGNAVGALSLYDVIYGDDDNQRVASHERAVLAVGATQFDAWAAVEPSCVDDPLLTVTFLARD